MTEWKKGDRFTLCGRAGTVALDEDTDWNPHHWRWCRHVLVRYDDSPRCRSIFDSEIAEMRRVE